MIETRVDMCTIIRAIVIRDKKREVEEGWVCVLINVSAILARVRSKPCMNSLVVNAVGYTNMARVSWAAANIPPWGAVKSELRMSFLVFAAVGLLLADFPSPPCFTGQTTALQWRRSWMMRRYLVPLLVG